MTPEEESKAATFEEFRVIEAHSADFGWKAVLDERGDYSIILVLLHSPRENRPDLLAKFTCDDYPKLPPSLDFLSPKALEDPTLRDTLQTEFYPKGAKGIAQDANRSPYPIVCLPGHRAYYAGGWHAGWSNPPPAGARLSALAQQLHESWNEDWT